MARVLVVEDDEDIRRLIVTRVQAAGHKCVAVGDGQAALDVVAEKGAPEVAVLDIGLPDMEGWDLLDKLREQLGAPDFPAVFLSARVQPEDIERGRAKGAQYLTKPVMGVPLINAIKAAVPEQSRGM